MGDTIEDGKIKPTIQVPPRVSMEFLTAGSGLGFSPGPMTLVSTLFPEQGQFSFSQLLAGAMASPLAVNRGTLSSNDLGQEGRKGSSSSVVEKNIESDVGQKLNRPTNLVVPPPHTAASESLSPFFAGLSPPGLLNSPGFLSPSQSPFGMSHQQALAHVTAQAVLSQSSGQKQAELQHSSFTSSPETLASCLPSAPVGTSIQQVVNPSSPEPGTSSEAFQSDKQMGSASGDKPASDGYSWRKYGQKHVKASEGPRSYYKCTYLNCPVKKKVERSLDGHISEITYKGHHNHDPPQPNKRVKDNSVTNTQAKPIVPPKGSASDTMNVAVPAHPATSNFQTTHQQSYEHNQFTNQNDAVKDTTSTVDEVDDDEPAAKRRNTNVGASALPSFLQTVTDSKIVLQTRSEVDLLDDGYRWRKYGQKVVKGNPHPRSYYKCTYMGCNVRKHVERASSDPKAVITTYEGKHNHDIPAGRYGAGNGSSQLKKKSSSENTEIDYENKDQMPVTLQLKKEQIVAS